MNFSVGKSNGVGFGSRGVRNMLLILIRDVNNACRSLLGDVMVMVKEKYLTKDNMINCRFPTVLTVRN